jgi:hypothetical protein
MQQAIIADRRSVGSGSIDVCGAAAEKKNRRERSRCLTSARYPFITIPGIIFVIKVAIE